MTVAFINGVSILRLFLVLLCYVHSRKLWKNLERTLKFEKNIISQTNNHYLLKIPIHSPSTIMNTCTANSCFLLKTASSTSSAANKKEQQPAAARATALLPARSQRQEDIVIGMQISTAPHSPSQQESNRVRRGRVKRDPKVLRKSTMDYSFIWETLVIESKELYPFSPCWHRSLKDDSEYFWLPSMIFT